MASRSSNKYYRVPRTFWKKNSRPIKKNSRPIFNKFSGKKSRPKIYLINSTHQNMFGSTIYRELPREFRKVAYRQSPPLVYCNRSIQIYTKFTSYLDFWKVAVSALHFSRPFHDLIEKKSSFPTFSRSGIEKIIPDLFPDRGNPDFVNTL